MRLTACFLLRCKIGGLHSKSCKVHLTSQPPVNSFGLSFRSKAQGGCRPSTSPLGSVGRGSQVSLGLLSFSMLDSMVSRNFLSSSPFSSLLQIDMGILKPRGKRHLVDQKFCLRLVNERWGNHILTVPVECAR